MKYTVVYGKRGLIAVYCEGDLACTHDKHTKGNGDFDRYLAKLEKQGHVITECKGEFCKFNEIPPTWCVEGGKADAPKRGRKPAEPDIGPDVGTHTDHEE